MYFNGGEDTSPMSFLRLVVRETCPGDIGDIILETSFWRNWGHHVLKQLKMFLKLFHVYYIYSIYTL